MNEQQSEQFRIDHAGYGIPPLDLIEALPVDGFDDFDTDTWVETPALTRGILEAMAEVDDANAP
jgi:hypothetical protein